MKQSIADEEVKGDEILRKADFQNEDEELI
jgi:hypothetical protein